MSELSSSPVQLQILNKVLATKDYSIIEDNLLSEDYFIGYSDEYNFIKDHVKQYESVPDKLTFVGQFENFPITEVTESDKYLVDKIREEYLFSQSVPILQKSAEIMKVDANEAVRYLTTSLKELQTDYNITATDIIADAQTRYNEYEERKKDDSKWFFTTGFPEIDDVIHGIQRTEEYVVLFARTNQGKSWILEKICSHIWQIGFNVGYISPEMGATSIGYRFDTLYQNISNHSLIWSNEIEGYKDYIDKLSTHKNKFVVATPGDFQHSITVSKIKNFIKQFKLDVVAIDGITYMSDDRSKRGDNKTTSLTNISEDLIELSIEMNVPILVVVQSNRSGVINKEDNGTPELESIRDSDGIAHNATKVISIKQGKDGLEIGIKKQRFGRVGDTFVYDWDIDLGKFTFLSSTNEESANVERRETDVSQAFVKKTGEDVF